jgi:hypothetical protein
MFFTSNAFSSEKCSAILFKKLLALSLIAGTSLIPG